MKTTKLFFMAALALMTAACSNDDNDLTQQPAKAEGIPFTATISLDQSATTRALTENGTTIEATWATGEKVALIHNGVKDEMTVSAVNAGVATINGTITGSPSGGDAVTIIYPSDAADGTTGNVKSDWLSSQVGTLKGTSGTSIEEKYDVRKGSGALNASGTSLDGTVSLTNQNAIFKFTTKSVPGAGGSLQNTDVTKLTVTIGSDNYVITPASATSTLYAALPAVDDQTVSFTATDGSNLYFASKASVSFGAAKYYQSTVKMGKVIRVFMNDDPKIGDFVNVSPDFNYLHIGLDQAYALAKQLSTQNDGAEVAVVYNNDRKTATYALSSDASATENTGSGSLVAYKYLAFLATLWESAQ